MNRHLHQWINPSWHLKMHFRERSGTKATGSGRLASGEKSLCHESSFILFSTSRRVHLWGMTHRVHDLSTCVLQWSGMPAPLDCILSWLWSTEPLKEKRLLPVNTLPILQEITLIFISFLMGVESLRMNLILSHTSININYVNISR